MPQLLILEMEQKKAQMYNLSTEIELDSFVSNVYADLESFLVPIMKHADNKVLNTSESITQIFFLGNYYIRELKLIETGESWRN